MSAFPLPTLRSTLGNILGAIIILFYFVLNKVFPYKTPFVVYQNLFILLLLSIGGLVSF